MTKEDVAGVQSLLKENLSKFHLSPVWSQQDVEHWLLPRENVIDTYVVEVHFSQLDSTHPLFKTTKVLTKNIKQ